MLSLTVSLRPPVATPEIVAEFVAHEGALCGYRVELLEAEQYHLCYLVFDVVKEDTREGDGDGSREPASRPSTYPSSRALARAA